MKYYRVEYDAAGEPRPLSGPVGVTVRERQRWTRSKGPLPTEEYVCKVLGPGARVDYSLSSFLVPVVSARLAEVLDRCDPCVQLLPTRVGAEDGFFAVNIFRQVPCLDESRSFFKKWTVEDNRPERLGEYRSVTMLYIDPKRVPPDARMFRLGGWVPEIIIRDSLRERILSLAPTGIAFRPV